MTLCCFCFTDSGRLQRLRYAGTVFYSERTGPAATAGLATLHGPDSTVFTSNWRDPSVRNRTRSPDVDAAPVEEAGVNYTTANADFMAKANGIEEIMKKATLMNEATDVSAKRDRSSCTLK